MRLALVASMFLVGSLAYADPSVTKNTDIGKRDVTSHHQVTRCEGDNCRINTVTRFNKKVKEKKIYSGECVFNEVDNMRVSQCDTKPGLKKKVKTKTVVKEKVIRKTKKNRIQLHIGYGPDGQKVEEDNNQTTVEERRRAIFGLQYTRALTDDWNLGGAVFTNKSATVILGYDFD